MFKEYSKSFRKTGNLKGFSSAPGVAQTLSILSTCHQYLPKNCYGQGLESQACREAVEEIKFESDNHIWYICLKVLLIDEMDGN